MRAKTKTVSLDRQGIDAASRSLQGWLKEDGAKKKEILRIRYVLEEMLVRIHENGTAPVRAELRLWKLFGSYRLQIRYGGEKYDPTQPADNEMEEWSSTILSQIGLLPVWRWRGGMNSLVFRLPRAGIRPEHIMLGCIIAALVIGLLGAFIPEAVKTDATNYALSFLSDGFIHLLTVFIGIMVFLCIVTGICGMGNAASFGRIGKQMILRFIGLSFLLAAPTVLVISLVFPLSSGGGSGGSQLQAILKMLFDIIPTDPITPFQQGNTLQIVLMAVITGIALLFVESETGLLRSFFVQAQTLVMRCVKIVCMLLPVYIVASLVMQFWKNGTDLMLQLWKPLVLCIAICAATILVYLVVTGRKLGVKVPVLLSKLLPSFIIALSTASSSAAFPTIIETTENKLGIDSSFSRTGLPIGIILFAGNFSMIYAINGAFLAEYYKVSANLAWWIILWLVCTLLTLATPPVSGGAISCLSILLLQLQIPKEGLVIGATLAILMDFFCTGARTMVIQMELALQADRLGLLDREILLKE